MTVDCWRIPAALFLLGNGLQASVIYLGKSPLLVHLLGFSRKNTGVLQHDLATKALMFCHRQLLWLWSELRQWCFLPLDSIEQCVLCVHFFAFAGYAAYTWQFKIHVIFVIV